MVPPGVTQCGDWPQYLPWPEEKHWLQNRLHTHCVSPAPLPQRKQTVLVRANHGLHYWWQWQTHHGEKCVFYVIPKLAIPVSAFTSTQAPLPKSRIFLGWGGSRHLKFQSSWSGSNEQPGLRSTAVNNCTLFSSPGSVEEIKGAVVPKDWSEALWHL